MRQATALALSAGDHHSSPWQTWEGHALVVGTGGIGRALLAALQDHAPRLRLWTAGRRGADLELDLADPESLERLSEGAREQLFPLRLVICAAEIGRAHV